jgi:cysteine-rich repeat protein
MIFVGTLAAAIVGCTSKNNATSADRICTPGNYVYCRCQDRTEGTKLCHDDGAGFDPCSCASPGNPEVPGPNPPAPPPAPGDDGGVDAPVESGPARCGNKVVENGEACDDGNTDDTDGCDQYCDLSGSDPASSKTCPGMEVHVWGANVVYNGTTNNISGLGNCSIDVACPSAAGNFPTNGAASPERIFHVTAHKTGQLTVETSDTDFDNFMYATTADKCTLDPPAPIDPYITCTNKVQGAGGETMFFAVDAGKSYTVVVDGSGISGNKGSFKVTFSIF